MNFGKHPYVNLFVSSFFNSQVNQTPSGRISDSPANLDNLRLKQDPSITAHLTRPLVEGLQEFTIVDKEVSCRFRVKLSNRNNTVSFIYLQMVISNKIINIYGSIT